MKCIFNGGDPFFCTDRKMVEKPSPPIWKIFQETADYIVWARPLWSKQTKCTCHTPWVVLFNSTLQHVVIMKVFYLVSFSISTDSYCLSFFFLSFKKKWKLLEKLYGMPIAWGVKERLKCQKGYHTTCTRFQSTTVQINLVWYLIKLHFLGVKSGSL